MSPTDPSQPPRPVVPRGLRAVGILIAILLILIVAVGLIQRARSGAELEARTTANAVPTVTVTQPQPLGEAAGLRLPARLEAYSQAPIRARASGYLKSWKADIGTRVKAGQVLAEIETPDLDQELAQARADLAKADADAELARSTAERWRSLLGTDAVSRQEVDEKIGDHRAKEAARKAARANVERLTAMQGFQRIVAPFDGIVTSRSTDVGALINAGGGVGPELFTVADIHKLRVYVQVPQNYMPSIKVGQTAKLKVPEYPDRSFPARIESIAGAITASTGASLIQLAVNNARGELLPGGYAEVSISLPGTNEGTSIPASSLIFDGSGMHVALLDADNKVRMKPVTISRDLGKTVEVIGLSGSDRVIDSPSDSLGEGDTARQAEKPAEKAAVPATPAQKDAPKRN